MIIRLWLLLTLSFLGSSLFGQQAKGWSRAAEYIERPSNDKNRQQRIERAVEHCKRILESSPNERNSLTKLLRIVGKRQPTIFPQKGPWLRDQYGALDVLLVATSRVIEKGLPVQSPPTYDLTREELKELTYRFTPGTNEQNLSFRAGAIRLLGMASVNGERLANEELMAPIDRLMQPRRRRHVGDALKVQELFDKLSDFISGPPQKRSLKKKSREGQLARGRKKYIFMTLLLFASLGGLALYVTRKRAASSAASQEQEAPEESVPSSSTEELLARLAALHAECIHALKGRLATAEVFRDEPERFGAHFLKRETLRELIEDLKGEYGPKARIDGLLRQREQSDGDISPLLDSAFNKLADHRSFYGRLVEVLEKVQKRQDDGKEIDLEQFMEGVRRLASQLKTISEALKSLLAHFEVDLSQLLLNRAESLLPESLRGRVDVQENLIRRTASCKEEREELSKLFDILLTNALEAKGSQIDILAEANFVDGQELLQIVIKDDGLGASKETLEKAFDRGFTTRDRGTGTGLWWAKRFIEARQGTIELSSTGEGKGASLKLTIPSLL